MYMDKKSGSLDLACWQFVPSVHQHTHGIVALKDIPITLCITLLLGVFDK